MPFLAAIPWLIPALTAGAAATGIGTGIYNAVNQPGQPSQPSAPPPPTAAQNVAAEVAKRQNEALIVNRQIPNLVDQTSGGLSDQGYQTFGSTAAGSPGAFGQGGFNLDQIMQFLNPSGVSGVSGGNPTNIMNLATSGPSITG